MGTECAKNSYFVAHEIMQNCPAAWGDEEQRVDTVVKLCERGHADKLVLSQEATCFNDWLPERALPARLPNWHYLHEARA